MKNHFLLLCLFFFPFSYLWSQTGWEFVFTDLDTRTRAMATNEQHVVVGGSKRDCPTATLFLFNQSGWKLWEKNPFDDFMKNFKNPFTRYCFLSSLKTKVQECDISTIAICDLTAQNHESWVSLFRHDSLTYTLGDTHLIYLLIKLTHPKTKFKNC